MINWKKINAKIWDYARNDITQDVGEDFIEFLKDYKKRLSKIKEIYEPKDDIELKQVALSFHNAYSQESIVKANKNLTLATWVLALATIAFAISAIWGSDTANNFVQIGFKVLIAIIFVAVFVGVIQFIIEILRRFAKFIISRQKHILCSNCGRIVWEYESDGDRRPAISTCPECLNKNKKPKYKNK